MSERDSWMRHYINRWRRQFLEALQTVVFKEEFPGLHQSTRERVTCRLDQVGSYLANSELLDNIGRIDNFPTLFIDFCEKHDCNIELANIVRQGLEIYESDRLRSTLRRSLQAAPGSQETPIGGRGGYLTQRDQEIFRDEHGDPPVEYSSHESCNGHVCLPHETLGMNIGNTNTGEQVSDDNIVADCEPNNSSVNEGTCDENTLEGAVGGVEFDVRRVDLDNHENNTDLARNNPDANVHCAAFKQDSLDLSQNNVTHRCPSEEIVSHRINLNRNSPAKKVYVSKLTAATTSVINDARSEGNLTDNFVRVTSDEDKKSNVMSKSDCLSEMHHTDSHGHATSMNQHQPVLGQNTLSYTSSCDDTSYYLSSSDEEEFIHDHEIENLKEPIPHSEAGHRFDESESASEDNQTSLKKIQRIILTESLESNFIVRNNPLNGIQCQEDIERNKIGTTLIEQGSTTGLNNGDYDLGINKPFYTVVETDEETKSENASSYDYYRQSLEITAGDDPVESHDGFNNEDHELGINKPLNQSVAIESSESLSTVIETDGDASSENASSYDYYRQSLEITAGDDPVESYGGFNNEDHEQGINKPLNHSVANESRESISTVIETDGDGSSENASSYDYYRQSLEITAGDVSVESHDGLNNEDHELGINEPLNHSVAIEISESLSTVIETGDASSENASNYNCNIQMFEITARNDMIGPDSVESHDGETSMLVTFSADIGTCTPESEKNQQSEIRQSEKTIHQKMSSDTAAETFSISKTSVKTRLEKDSVQTKHKEINSEVNASESNLCSQENVAESFEDVATFNSTTSDELLVGDVPQYIQLSQSPDLPTHERELDEGVGSNNSAAIQETNLSNNTSSFLSHCYTVIRNTITTYFYEFSFRL